MSEPRIIPELIAQIRKIQIIARKLANAPTAGGYRSAFRGQGLEFDQVREYIPGDEIRSIDWKVTARLGHPYVKSYREERELTVLLACDVSGSTRSAAVGQTRDSTIAQIGAFLALLARKGNDQVGLALFTDRVEQYLPPRKVRAQAWRIVHEVLRPRKATGRTSLNALAKFLRTTLKKRSVIFILSDFLDQSFEQSLGSLARRHDVIAVMIIDEAERALPNVGLLEVQDPETGEVSLVDTSLARARYAEAVDRERKRQRQALLKFNIDVLEVRTDRPFVPVFARYFEQRGSHGA